MLPRGTQESVVLEKGFAMPEHPCSTEEQKRHLIEDIRKEHSFILSIVPRSVKSIQSELGLFVEGNCLNVLLKQSLVLELGRHGLSFFLEKEIFIVVRAFNMRATLLTTF